jgi:hypothetical protein
MRLVFGHAEPTVISLLEDLEIECPAGHEAKTLATAGVAKDYASPSMCGYSVAATFAAGGFA